MTGWRLIGRLMRVIKRCPDQVELTVVATDMDSGRVTSVRRRTERFKQAITALNKAVG